MKDDVISDNINSEKDALKQALKALVGSVDQLGQAVDNQSDISKRLSSLDNEMSDMMLDRSRLAQSLDKAEARAQRLQDVNREVSRRLVGAMETIRSVLDGQKIK